MKKIYTTLALAAAICVSAYAEKPVQMMGEAGLLQLTDLTAAGVVESPAKAPARAASINSFTGYFTAEYEWPFSSSDPGTTVSVQAIDDTQVAMTFHPWGDYSNVDISPVIAKVDLAAGTITINTQANQNLGTYEDSTGKVSGVNWTAIHLSSDGAGGTVQTPMTEIVGTLNADGSIQFGGVDDMCGFAVAGGGYLGMFRNLKLVAPDYFQFNESEWESAGTASYQEFIINPLLNNPIPAVDVPLMKSTKEDGLYLLKNPYTAGSWAQVNERTNTDGYIVFSIATPSCVWLRPLTPGGFWMDMGDGTTPEIEEFYFYNLEGDYVVNEEADPEEVGEVLRDEDYDVSYYDEKAHKCYIYNVLFGNTSNPAAGYTWVAYKDLTMEITLPAGIDAVEGIINDADNAAPRYFNLQGLEIANPAAGELVIVKQGNKTTKTIVK